MAPLVRPRIRRRGPRGVGKGGAASACPLSPLSPDARAPLALLAARQSAKDAPAIARLIAASLFPGADAATH